MNPTRPARRLRALILAGGEAPLAGGSLPIIMQPLGDGWVVDHVIGLARRFVSATDIVIVAGRSRTALEQHVGPGPLFVSQDEPRGTADAVLQAHLALANFDGDLLLLYGDTPLFRPASLRGLLNRHRQTGAALTFLCTLTGAALPYGRVERGEHGNILKIIEAADDPTSPTGLVERNLGAYVATAEALFAAVASLQTAATAARLRLTDTVPHLIAAGHRVDAFRVFDPDEILGINNAVDLAQSEVILQQRVFKPDHAEDETAIRFGTGGWRAVIGEGFTLHHVRCLSQAVANAMVRGRDQRPVVVGFDRRFLSDRAAVAAAEVLAANNVAVVLLPEAAPTPLITFATAQEHAAYGFAFTASHNPPEYNGLKIFRADGALLPDAETQALQAEANALCANALCRVELDIALAAGMVRRRDWQNAYLDAIEAQVDMGVIRNAGLRVIIDPMYGVGKATLEVLFTEARCRVTTIHARHDALFGGRSPAPEQAALSHLVSVIRGGGFDLGVATDGDADRIAIVDERGDYVSSNDILLLLYFHLHGQRGMRGAVVRNLATTHRLDRLAAHFGERSFETPVGFKHIVLAMQEHQALLGGESSGGLTIRGHILGKDGILAAALVAEMLAQSGRPVSELMARIHGITGRTFFAERVWPATAEMRVALPRRLARAELRCLGGEEIHSISNLDGTKLVLGDGAWVLWRFSGTEPLLRLASEADSEARAQALIEHTRQFLGLAPPVV